MNQIMTGAIVCESAMLEDEIEIGYNTVILSGSFKNEITNIRHGAVIGSNVTINKGVTVGTRAKVLSGSVVKSSIPPLAIVEGNPAAIVGYVETTLLPKPDSYAEKSSSSSIIKTTVRGVTFHKFPNIIDMRGNLAVGEFEREIPFNPKRMFLVYEVPSIETRGEHAHITCKQFLVAVRGSVHVVADDGNTREEFILDHPRLGIYLPPMTWGIQYKYTKDAMLLVLASEYYDSADYIRDYNIFLDQIRKAG